MFDFQYTQAQLDAQTAALSMPMQIWLNWMIVVIVLMPLIFIRRPQGRIAILCSILLIACAMPVSRIVGISNFLSLIHLLIWTPLVLYFCYQLRQQHIPIKSFFGIWSLTMISTAIVSLVFDVRDFARWLMGDRGIVTAPANIEIAWVPAIFMVLCIGLAGAYIFKKLPGDHSNH